MNLKTCLAALCSLIVAINSASAQSTAFTYQGQLSTNGTAANGNFDFTFALFDAPTNGYQQGPSITNLGVTVANGSFTVTNDFGAAPWNGQGLWLELQVRTNNGGAFTVLSPREAATSSPYAIQALNALNATIATNALSAAVATTAVTAQSIAASNITGTLLNTTLTPNPIFVGTVKADSFIGDAGGLTGLPSIPWLENIQPVPDLGIESWATFQCAWGNSNAPGFGTNSENWLTNVILMMGSNMVPYRWDHLWMTDGTFNSRDAHGYLTWNTNIFTKGIPYYTALAHSNGVKLLCYTSMSSATCCYNPGLGYGPGNFIQQDLFQMMDLGFDGTMIDICDDGGNFNNTNVLETFWRTVHDAVVAYQTAVFATNGKTRPFQIQCTLDGLTIDQQRLVPSQYVTCQDFGINPAGGLDFFSALTNAHAILNSWTGLIGVSKYPLTQTVYQPGSHLDQDTNTMNMFSMYLGEMRSGCAHATASSMSAINAAFTSEFTPQIFLNTNVLAIYLDPACIPASVVWSNSLDEVWMRPLGGTGQPHEAVLCVNANSSNQTFTVNVSSLQLQSNTIYSLSDPYQGGAVLSNFQNSFTLTVSPTNSRLVQVDLNAGANAQFGSVTIATNLAAGSLSVSGTTTLSSNLIVSSSENVGGSVTASSGFASTATNNAAPSSTSGITNKNGVTWVYDITGTNVTIAQFDGRTNWWDTNIAFTGSKELIIQPGGGWTNTGVVTVTGAHAF
jgi:hypothetical protein